jgi:hypothetical protein
MTEYRSDDRANTFVFDANDGDDPEYEHRVGDFGCKEGWCGGIVTRFPQPCERDGCGGLVHANFGDEEYDGYNRYYVTATSKANAIDKAKKEGEVMTDTAAPPGTAATPDAVGM